MILSLYYHIVWMFLKICFMFSKIWYLVAKKRFKIIKSKKKKKKNLAWAKGAVTVENNETKTRIMKVTHWDFLAAWKEKITTFANWAMTDWETCEVKKKTSHDLSRNACRKVQPSKILLLSLSHVRVKCFLRPMFNACRAYQNSFKTRSVYRHKSLQLAGSEINSITITRRPADRYEERWRAAVT